MGYKTIGAPPGSLEFIGEKKTDTVSLRLTVYDSESIEVTENFSLDDFETLSAKKNYWLEIAGIHNPDLISKVCEKFKIHALVSESILDTQSQPSFEDLGDLLFTVIKVPLTDKHSLDSEIQQVSVILKKGIMITFVEESLDLFSPIQKRLSKKNTRIRDKGLDYLNWAILDLITDHALYYIDQMENSLEDLEASISNEKSLPDISLVHGARRDISHMHRSIRPFRDIANSLRLCESELLTEKSSAYFNDLYNHAIQTVEMSEFLREHAASLRELYFTITNNRLNDAMKVLTGISVIFLPLSFLTGVYGMNFDHIPELHWKWSYQCLLGLFAIIALSIYIVFKRKKWF